MEHSPLTWRERAQLWLRLGLRGALALGGVALFVYVGLPLASLLSPFLFALVLAWVLNPAVRWLQRRTRLSRKAVSLVLVVLVFAVIGGVLFGLGWMAVDQVRMLFDNRQSLLDELLNGLVGAVNSVGGWLEGLGDFLPQGVVATSEDLMDALIGWARGLDYDRWLTEMAGQAPSMAANVSNFAVALVVFMMASYFITGDYPRLRFEITDRVPAMTRDFCRSVKDIFMSAFGGYVKSQLILSAGVFAILSAGFFLMGQPYGLLLAFGLAVLDFIPIIGSGTVMVWRGCRPHGGVGAHRPVPAVCRAQNPGRPDRAVPHFVPGGHLCGDAGRGRIGHGGGAAAAAGVHQPGQAGHIPSRAGRPGPGRPGHRRHFAPGAEDGGKGGIASPSFSKLSA